MLPHPHPTPSDPTLTRPQGRHPLDNGNNTFRGLRAIDVSANGKSAWSDVAYFEFTDVSEDWNFENPSFFELYDLGNDPAQLKNVYKDAPEDLKLRLRERLRKLYACRGTGCRYSSASTPVPTSRSSSASPPLKAPDKTMSKERRRPNIVHIMADDL